MFGRLGRWRAVWKAAVVEERERPRIKRLKQEREFLPAALEVLDTPGSPAARAIAILIVLLFVCAIAWGMLGKIDTVAVAPGKIIPGGRIKLVQPLEIGVVRAIHVKEGQQVRKGDLLIELDPTASGADRERLKRDLMAAKLDIARLSAMISGTKDALAKFGKPSGLDERLYAASRALLRGQLEAYRSKLASLDAEVRQQQAGRMRIRANISRLSKTIPLLAQRVVAREYLAKRRHGTKAAFLELQQQLVDMQGELRVARHQLEEVTEAIRSQVERTAELKASFGAKANDELSKAIQRVAALTQELRKAEERHRLRTLRAPVDGVVQQLKVNTIGGVVNPAESLMVIVPRGSRLVIEANVLNKDIGFVSAGQDAEIKVESFPFTKYGLIDGKVEHVSADAVPDKDLGLVYAARIVMNESRILVGSRWVPLAPGMAVTVEVKTGKRRLIEFFLSPFQKYRNEALRER